MSSQGFLLNIITQASCCSFSPSSGFDTLKEPLNAQYTSDSSGEFPSSKKSVTEVLPKLLACCSDAIEEEDEYSFMKEPLYPEFVRNEQEKSLFDPLLACTPRFVRSGFFREVEAFRVMLTPTTATSKASAGRFRFEDAGLKSTNDGAEPSDNIISKLISSDIMTARLVQK